MYQVLIILHSLVRWLVLVSLVYAIYRAYFGWFSKKVFSSFDNKIRHWTATIAHIQLVIGFGLYFISPVINYFLHNYKEALHQREIRFFGMEHSVTMFIAIVLITIGSTKTKRAHTNVGKFKTMALWFTLALIIIFALIPWSFSPMASRPYFRF